MLLVFSAAGADTLISGFSPGENPFVYGGMFGSFAQNADGTETVREEARAGFWTVALISEPSDLTNEGQNNAITLRMKREPDHTSAGDFRLSFSSRTGDLAFANLSLDAFPVGEFGNVTIPFSSFFSQINPFDGTQMTTNFNRIVEIQIGGVTHGGTIHLTFDSLSAVQIPEPSIIALLTVGLMFFGRNTFTRLTPQIASRQWVSCRSGDH